MKPLAALLAALLVLLPLSPRAGDLPSPDPEHPPLELAPGQTLELAVGGVATGQQATVPELGGIYLDPQAYAFQVALRRWYEHEIATCTAEVDARPPGGAAAWVIGGTVGAVAGVVLGVFIAGRLSR